MKCKKCGAEFDEGSFCPECGERIVADIFEKESIKQDSTNYQTDRIQRNVRNVKRKTEAKKRNKDDNRGIWSLVLGILSWVAILTVVIPLICGIISIVQGIIALKRKTKHIIPAVIGIGLSLLLYIFVIWSFTIPSNPSTSTQNDSLEKITVETTTEIIPDVTTETMMENVTDTTTETMTEIVTDTTTETMTEIVTDATTETMAEIVTDTTTETMTETVTDTTTEVGDEVTIEDNGQDTNDVELENSIYVIYIYIDYARTKLSYNDDVYIYVDGEKIGELYAGNSQTYEVFVYGGKHKIWVESDTKIRHNNSSKVKFEVDDNNTTFEFDLKDKSLGGLKLKKR